jgi:hypothetical protein
LPRRLARLEPLAIAHHALPARGCNPARSGAAALATPFAGAFGLKEAPMNDVPRRPGSGEHEETAQPAARPELATVDQTTLAPTERRFADGLPTDGQNGQNATPARVARPSDPGATPGIGDGIAPPGADNPAERGRGAPRLGRGGD